MTIEFPVARGLLTVAGMALFCGLVIQWIKHALPDWRLTNLAALAVSLVVGMIALLVTTNFQPGGEQVLDAALVAFCGASLATFGYETIANILGFMGLGRRSERAITDAALEHLNDVLGRAAEAVIEDRPGPPG